MTFDTTFRVKDAEHLTPGMHMKQTDLRALYVHKDMS
jgi:hypothetical protein